MKNVESISKEQIRFAHKNQAFNALVFVFTSLLSLFRQIDGEDRSKELMELFRPLYDNLSKEFVPDLTSLKHE